MDVPSSSSPSLPHPMHYHAISYPNCNPTSSDLPATISVLQDLTILAESTLKSVSDFISTNPNPSTASPNLGRCPFDSRHLMPPESLFRHSLTCSSAPGSPISDLQFLDNLQYTKSFKSEDQLLKENLFLRPLPEADTCFSLDDEFGKIYSNFFYKDCPGVVTTPEPDATIRTFTLPAILSTECANFMNDHGLAGGDSELMCGIFPSDFWALRIEVESWKNIPVSYSLTALAVAVGLHNVDEPSMKKWVILNSPRFGILIDAAMRDHIFLLLKLCLKAVRREAACSLKLVFEKNECLVSKVVRYECPQLVSSITWLSFQISVLYGDMNGKLFVMGMVKESFLLVGRHLMLFTSEKGEIKSDAKVISSDSECNGRECLLELDKSVENMEVKIRKPSECSSYDKLFLSQVASAIAALHERFLLEQRVIALRSSQAMPRYQLINEYISTTIRASQERARRPNYRPLLEYDGLLWQRQNMQDFGKSKTREELLAEERDYKRRRMSYRGKKVKRNPLQVLHDIIEEHTEEIKQAGGIGCNVKLPSGSTLVSKFDCDRNKDFGLQQSNANNAHQTIINNKSQPYAGNLTVSRPEFDSSNELSSISSLQTSFHGYEDQDKVDKSKLKTPRSRSPSYHTDYSCSNERNSRHNHPRSPSRAKHDRRDKDHDSRSTFTSKSQEARKYEYNRTPESRTTYGSRASERQRADSAGNVFDDRYEPSRSHDTFYDRHCHSPRSQKPHKLPNDAEHRQRSYKHDLGRSEYHRKQ